uniref:Uncharacterized protein n=1 Tax=Zea mays TaxID=4577 RepID=A0A804MFH7_MAIZE
MCLRLPPPRVALAPVAPFASPPGKFRILLLGCDVALLLLLSLPSSASRPLGIRSISWYLSDRVKSI